MRTLQAQVARDLREVGLFGNVHVHALSLSNAVLGACIRPLRHRGALLCRTLAGVPLLVVPLLLVVVSTPLVVVRTHVLVVRRTPLLVGLWLHSWWGRSHSESGGLFVCSLAAADRCSPRVFVLAALAAATAFGAAALALPIGRRLLRLLRRNRGFF